MRFIHPDGTLVHLSYCSNVHPAEDVDGIVEQLKRFAGPMRSQLDVDSLGVGLWIPIKAATELTDDPSKMASLRKVIEREQLEIVTLNGFPYGGFHDPVVKHKVFRPNWSKQERLDYTVRLARILVELLPEDINQGSISTMPLLWRDRKELLPVALDNIKKFVDFVMKLESETGKRIRLAVEPEPGSLIGNLASTTILAGLPAEYVGVCFDVCHMSVEFENVYDSLATLNEVGLDVVKTQVASALRVPNPLASKEMLKSFVEPRFLHQSRERIADGSLLRTDDLPEALEIFPGENEWRVHFHSPVHWGGEDVTQRELIDTLDVLVGGDKALCNHLDVETYTWSVLPEDRRPQDDQGLINGMVEELRWTRDRLIKLSLQE